MSSVLAQSLRPLTGAGALLTLALLPAIGAAWPPETGIAGVYAGVLTTPDGQLYAVSVLPDTPDQRLSWDAAMAWAASLGDDANLPTRPESALLFANTPELFEKAWHWTGEQFSAHTAWGQDFDDGFQNYYGKAYEGRARAVRRFKLGA